MVLFTEMFGFLVSTICGIFVYSCTPLNKYPDFPQIVENSGEIFRLPAWLEKHKKTEQARKGSSQKTGPEVTP